jgi:hypothetical protein
MNLGIPGISDWFANFAIAVGVALVIATVISLFSARLLGLAAEFKLWCFIVGFGFLTSLASVQFTQDATWSGTLIIMSLPLLATFVYFLPTAGAITVGNPEFRTIFILNLFFGWTVVGWIVALVWTARGSAASAAALPGYRLTPFGAVPIDSSRRQQTKQK